MTMGGTNANSRNLFDNGKRRFIGAAKVSTNAFSQLLSREQSIGLYNSLLGMDPLRLDRVEPGTFSGQKEGQNAHAFALLLDLMIVLTNPASHHLARMKGGIIERLSSQAVLPCAWSRAQHHSRNWVVMALTGRPVTKRSNICLRTGSAAEPCCQSTP